MITHRLKKSKSRAEEEMEHGDRLSVLPQELIHHILSFLDTKFAVQTCQLSKRWKSLWTSLPNLTFNSCNFRKLTSFDEFVSQILARRCGSNIRDFNFTRSGSINCALLEKIVKFVRSRRIERLGIDIISHTNPDSKCVSNIFYCPSLKDIKVITYKGYCALPHSFELVALTSLHLEKVWFYGSHSAGFFSNCMNLKNFTLIDCCILGVEVFNISSPQLAYLTILWGSFCRGKTPCKIVVSTPKLISFTLKGFPMEFIAQSVPSLEKVELDTYEPYQILGWTGSSKECVSQLINVLPELRNAKSVTLSSSAIELLSLCPDLLMNRPSPFRNLKSLKLKWQRSISSTVPQHVVAYFRKGTPEVAVDLQVS